MRSRSIFIAILALCLSASAPLRAADAPTQHQSDGLQLSFEIPGACVAREELHQPDDPTRQISHAVTLSCGGPVLLRVDMWLAPDDRPVSAWVEARLGPLIKGATLVAARGENLAHLLAWCIDEQMTVLQLLRKPFYHPTMEEALQGALRDVLSKLDLEKTDVPPELEVLT